MIILLSDNGASQEGGPLGTTNTIAYENENEVDLNENLRHLDDIGGWRCHSNYPWGWAQAGNTPLKRYKQNTHAGGVRTPLIVSWPAGVETSGEYRRQFHDVIDITPTVMEIVGIDMPEEFHGVPQLQLDGTSMRYTFDNCTAESRRSTQYFEMYGHRAIIKDGWKAVAHHQRHSRYDDDQWELYHIASDFSEFFDLSHQHPYKLHELIGSWWAEAERYGVFPLDDRNFAERAAQYHSPASPAQRRRFVLYPGMQRIPAGVTPLIYDRSYRIDANVQMTLDDCGVLVAQGDVNGGYVLWIDNRELRYEYNHEGQRYFVRGPFPVDMCPGRHILSMKFEKTGVLQGIARMQVDGTVVGSGEIASTARYMLGWQGLEIGRDALSPVSERYPREFEFTGQLNTVIFDLEEDGFESGHEVID